MRFRSILSVRPMRSVWGARLVLFAAILVMVAAGPVHAAKKWQIGPHLVVSVPLDEFENVAEVGVGIGAKVDYELSDSFGLRADGAIISFGSGQQTLGADPNFGVTIAEFDTQGLRIAVGPRWARRSKTSSLGGYAQAGLFYFRQSVTVNSPVESYSDSANKNYAPGWTAGIGAMFDVGLGPWLDFGVEYQAMYGLPGPVLQNSTEPGFPVNGPDVNANELTIKAGVSFFISRAPSDS